MVAVEQLQDRLLLGRVQLDALIGNELDEPVERRVGVRGRREVIGEQRGGQNIDGIGAAGPASAHRVPVG